MFSVALGIIGFRVDCVVSGRSNFSAWIDDVIVPHAEDGTIVWSAVCEAEYQRVSSCYIPRGRGLARGQHSEVAEDELTSAHEVVRRQLGLDYILVVRTL